MHSLTPRHREVRGEDAQISGETERARERGECDPAEIWGKFESGNQESCAGRTEGNVEDRIEGSFEDGIEGGYPGIFTKRQ